MNSIAYFRRQIRDSCPATSKWLAACSGRVRPRAAHLTVGRQRDRLVLVDDHVSSPNYACSKSGNRICTMTIQISCPHCSAQLRAKSDSAGRTGTCKHCKGKFVIPLPDAPASTPPDNDSEIPNFLHSFHSNDDVPPSLSMVSTKAQPARSWLFRQLTETTLLLRLVAILSGIGFYYFASNTNAIIRLGSYGAHVSWLLAFWCWVNGVASSFRLADIQLRWVLPWTVFTIPFPALAVILALLPRVTSTRITSPAITAGNAIPEFDGFTEEFFAFVKKMESPPLICDSCAAHATTGCIFCIQIELNYENNHAHHHGAWGISTLVTTTHRELNFSRTETKIRLCDKCIGRSAVVLERSTANYFGMCGVPAFFMLPHLSDSGSASKNSITSRVGKVIKRVIAPSIAAHIGKCPEPAPGWSLSAVAKMKRISADDYEHSIFYSEVLGTGDTRTRRLLPFLQSGNRPLVPHVVELADGTRSIEWERESD